jgi:hypothetical protein
LVFALQQLLTLWDALALVSVSGYVDSVLSQFETSHASNRNRKLTKEHRVLPLQTWWRKNERSQEVIAAFTKKFRDVEPPTNQATRNLSVRGEKHWKYWSFTAVPGLKKCRTDYNPCGRLLKVIV